MRKQKTTYYIAVVSILLILAVLALAKGGLRRSGNIVLPTEQTDTGDSDDSGAAEGLDVVRITPATVQPAINTLSRPATYSRTQRVETYWSGGSGVSESQVSVSGGRTITQQLIKKGMVMIPEDRKNCGIFPRRDLKENITAAQIDHFVNRRVKFFGFRREKENAQKVIDRFRVACPGIEAYITELSGGNQQKIIVGRWLSHSPKVCMFDDPTRGVDVGSRAEIGEYIVELAKTGTAVILVSSDLNELVSMAHRIIVMRRGRMVSELMREDFDVRRILSIASSQQEDESSVGGNHGENA